MATNDGNGTRRIQFSMHGKRHTIRLGKMTAAMATAFELRVRHLVAAKVAGIPIDAETAAWLARVGDEHHDRIARTGLVPPRDARPATPALGEFLAGYLAKQTDSRPNTLSGLKYAFAKARDYFGDDRRLDEVTLADAADFLRHLRKTLADSTANRNASWVRQGFAYAVDARILTENPFRKLKLGSPVNHDRFRQVTPEEFRRLVDAAPGTFWRCLLALCRIGGLRAPSEAGSLRWADIDFAGGWITVRSPKTARHASGLRRVPLYPELRPFLTEAFEAAPVGSEFVLGELGGSTRNYRPTLHRCMQAAGLALEKPFLNLRASRECELVRLHPAHVVAKWQGHTVAVQSKHYLHATDADAVGDLTTPGLSASQKASHLGDVEGHKPTFSDVSPTEGVRSNTLPHFALRHHAFRREDGISSQPESSAPEISAEIEGLSNGASRNASHPPDGLLARLAEIWPNLPPTVQGALLAMAEAAIGQRADSRAKNCANDPTIKLVVRTK